MPETIDAVKKIEDALALGFTLSAALPLVLGRSLSAFADEFGHSRSEMSMCLSFYGGRIYEAIRADLSRETGIPRETLDSWIERRAVAVEPAA